MATEWHIHIPVDAALAWSDAELLSAFESPEPITANEVRDWLMSQLEKGRWHIVCGSCDNQTPDGKCAGHKVEP